MSGRISNPSPHGSCLSQHLFQCPLPVGECSSQLAADEELLGHVAQPAKSHVVFDHVANDGSPHLLPRFLSEFDLDFSVIKDFKFGERFSLQLRGEFFNILNHPNFADPDHDLSDGPTLGLAQFTPDIFASNPVIGSGGSRHVQVGAKIIW